MKKKKGFTFLKMKHLYNNIYLCNQEDKQFIHIIESDIFIEVKKDGYIPKSGLLLSDYLLLCDLKNKSVLDIGTGETGFIANYSKFLGAKDVYGVDIDPEIIKHAQSAYLKDIQKINWHVSNIFSFFNQNLKFDFIVSNPPQMPMEVAGNTHDYGGEDGRIIIEKIIKNSKNFTHKDSKLIILLFDFLGVDISYNNSLSLFKFASNINMSSKIIKSYKNNIRKGGQTEKNINWIRKKFPKYKFKMDENNNLYFHSLIVEFNNK